MSPATLKVPGRSLGEWLREIHGDRRTGKLQITLEGETRELYFLAGDLYLAPGHPAYDEARSWVGGKRRAADDSNKDLERAAPGGEKGSAPLFRELLGSIIELSGGAEASDWSFASGAKQIRIDLVGPLPTGQLVMECAVWGADEPGLWHRLGGDEVVLRASVGLEESMAGVQIEPQEAFLLSRLDQPAKVGELVNQLDLGTEQVLRSLCRLQAVGLVERLADGLSIVDPIQPKQKMVVRFEESVADSLAEKPLEIEAEVHREVLGSLMSRMGELTYFEILSVSTQSSEDEIHEAYLELGRLVHPSHAEGLGLSGKEGAFRVLFERATDAYLTLNDPSRRLEYIRELGPSSQILTDGPDDEQRDRERKEMARAHYVRALALVERQDFHAAIQLMEQAISGDPKIEYLTLLGDCQAENPQWLDRAAQSYESALEIRPEDPSLFTRLGRVHERRGSKMAARRAYEAALAVAPEMEDARAGLWRVGGGRPTGEKLTLVSRLRGLLKI